MFSLSKGNSIFQYSSCYSVNLYDFPLRFSNNNTVALVDVTVAFAFVRSGFKYKSKILSFNDFSPEIFFSHHSKQQEQQILHRNLLF